MFVSVLFYVGVCITVWGICSYEFVCIYVYGLGFSGLGSLFLFGVPGWRFCG